MASLQSARAATKKKDKKGDEFMRFFKTKIEKDFTFFVNNIGKLQPAEFLGLAKVMSVPIMRGLDEIGMTVEELKALDEEQARVTLEKLIIPTDKILEQMMDKFLSLSKQARTTIIQILKDTQRGK